MILQKIINLFNKESDYELGFEVAKEHYTAYYDVSINIASDLYNFRAELEEEYGKEYAQQTEAYIKRSVILAEDMPPYIIADPTQAALMKKHQPTDFRIIHFLKMMTDIYSCWEEPSKIGIAKAYCKFGILLLDENEPHYKTYSKLFEGYKKTIMEREWDRN